MIAKRIRLLTIEMETEAEKLRNLAMESNRIAAMATMKRAPESALASRALANQLENVARLLDMASDELRND